MRDEAKVEASTLPAVAAGDAAGSGKSAPGRWWLVLLLAAGMFALGFALAKELSGEAELERAQQSLTVTDAQMLAQQPSPSTINQCATRKDIYLQLTEHRFKNIRRCC